MDFLWIIFHLGTQRASTSQLQTIFGQNKYLSKIRCKFGPNISKKLHFGIFSLQFPKLHLKFHQPIGNFLFYLHPFIRVSLLPFFMHNSLNSPLFLSQYTIFLLFFMPKTACDLIFALSLHKSLK